MLEESEDGEDHRANRDEDAAGEIIWGALDDFLGKNHSFFHFRCIVSVQNTGLNTFKDIFSAVSR